MSDLQEYIEQRKESDPEFAANYEEGYKQFQIGATLRQTREEAGLTREEVAENLDTNKSAISRIENRPGDISLSTLEKYAEALGFKIKIQLEKVGETD